MSLLSQPGVIARDLISVIPVRWQDPADPDVDLGQWVPLRAIRVYSRKLGSAESFREGKADLSVNYRIYADYRRGAPPSVTERMRLWHPEGSDRKPDGTPDYSTALDIQSVVTYPDEGVAEIQAGRTY